MQKADVGISTEDIMYLLAEADLNVDGTISFSEFRSLIYGLWRVRCQWTLDLECKEFITSWPVVSDEWIL